MFNRLRNRRFFKIGGMAMLAILVWVAGCSTNQAESGKEAQAGNNGHLTAEQSHKLALFVQSANELAQVLEDGEVESARSKLTQLYTLAGSIPLSRLITAEGEQVLRETMDRLAALLDGMEGGGDERGTWERLEETAYALFMGADALTHEHQPLWRQLGSRLAEATWGLEQALMAGDVESARREYRQLQQRYQLIRTALWLDRPASQAAELDALVNALGEQVAGSRRSDDAYISTMYQWKEALDALFGMGEEREAIGPVVLPAEPLVGQWLFIWIFILLVLTYVGWRMYQGDMRLVRIPLGRGKGENRDSGKPFRGF